MITFIPETTCSKSKGHGKTPLYSAPECLSCTDYPANTGSAATVWQTFTFVPCQQGVLLMMPALCGLTRRFAIGDERTRMSHDP